MNESSIYTRKRDARGKERVWVADRKGVKEQREEKSKKGEEDTVMGVAKKMMSRGQMSQSMERK